MELGLFLIQIQNPTRLTSLSKSVAEPPLHLSNPILAILCMQLFLNYLHDPSFLSKGSANRSATLKFSQFQLYYCYPGPALRGPLRKLWLQTTLKQTDYRTEPSLSALDHPPSRAKELFQNGLRSTELPN